MGRLLAGGGSRSLAERVLGASVDQQALGARQVVVGRGRRDGAAGLAPRLQVIARLVRLRRRSGEPHLPVERHRPGFVARGPARGREVEPGPGSPGVVREPAQERLQHAHRVVGQVRLEERPPLEEACPTSDGQPLGARRLAEEPRGGRRVPGEEERLASEERELGPGRRGGGCERDLERLGGLGVGALGGEREPERGGGAGSGRAVGPGLERAPRGDLGALGVAEASACAASSHRGEPVAQGRVRRRRGRRSCGEEDHGDAPQPSYRGPRGRRAEGFRACPAGDTKWGSHGS